MKRRILEELLDCLPFVCLILALTIGTGMLAILLAIAERIAG